MGTNCFTPGQSQYLGVCCADEAASDGEAEAGGVGASTAAGGGASDEDGNAAEDTQAADILDASELSSECGEALADHECTANFGGNAKNMEAHAFAMLAERLLEGGVRHPDTGEVLPRAVIKGLHMVRRQRPLLIDP